MDQVSPIPLASPPLLGAIERAVSAHLGRTWAARAARDMAEFACHPAAILGDGTYAVFAKLSQAPNGAEQFEIELAGLRLLAARAGVLIPTPVGILPVEAGTLLILEAVEAVERAPRQWREIGQALARIHQGKGAQFGLERHGYFGPLYQDNAPAPDWPTFYAQRRLAPGLRGAVDAGHMPPRLAGQIERLILRLPELCGPQVAPTLLHGDAQQNNFISTAQGAVVIDPAVYYGHPEMDLAYIDYFQAVPGDVLDGYHEHMPIDPGFWARRDLWRIWGYLAAVTVEGPAYLPRLAAAVERFC